MEKKVFELNEPIIRVESLTEMLEESEELLAYSVMTGSSANNAQSSSTCGT